MTHVSIVMPCYNEEPVIARSIGAMLHFLRECLAEGRIRPGSELVLVDDGSGDRSWELICDAIRQHGAGDIALRGIRLSRNCGHQNALLAGLASIRGDFAVTIDADLQDDVQAIKAMLDHAARGADIVYGVRSARDTDSPFKRLTALFFYKLMALLGVNIVFNHADFRGMSSRAVHALLQYPEVNLFLRGIVPQLGFSDAVVYYERKKRLAGETKYPLRKMLSFAWQGITSFSAFPLKLLTCSGVVFFLASFAIIVWILYQHWMGTTVPGWTSTIVPIMFFSGIQLLACGIMGEYLSKIYLEVKKRPRYFIAETADRDTFTQH